jgi:hypothetical protein
MENLFTLIHPCELVDIVQEIQSQRDQEVITVECTAAVNELKDRLAALGQVHGVIL